MKTKSFYAWAIDTRSEEGHNLIGRYWWFGGFPPGSPPVNLEGCESSLFKTRAIARENLKWVRGEKKDGKFHAFPKATVVRVEVSIREATKVMAWRGESRMKGMEVFNARNFIQARNDNCYCA